MKEVTIIHNPRCSKSREALALIESKGITPKVILYLENELTESYLREVIGHLGVHPRELLRTKEDEFKSLKINLEDADEIISAMLKHPKLIERPIVIRGKKAVVGRPPQNVLELF